MIIWWKMIRSPQCMQQLDDMIQCGSGLRPAQTDRLDRLKEEGQILLEELAGDE